MNIKDKIHKLMGDVFIAQGNLADANKALFEAQSNIQNHVYESLDKAEWVLYDLLYNIAGDACEGSCNCGEGSYSQDFIVDSKEYEATVVFLYNRWDKTFYYIDESEYSYKAKSC